MILTDLSGKRRDFLRLLHAVAGPSKVRQARWAIATMDAQQQQLFIRILGNLITAMPTIRP